LLDAFASESTPITKWFEWGSSSNDDSNKYVFGEQKRFDHNRCLSDYEYIDVYNKLYNPVLSASNHYADKHAIDIGTMAPLSLSRYFEGKTMGSHTESDERPTISVVMYLNDNYEGGELYFREQGVTIKAKSGDIVIFPSKTPFFHESRPIISGTKYICPGFWNKL
jgi:predicted 2-oxoglutarate/Fe(II)-dependent dioxygenase YbiX